MASRGYHRARRTPAPTQDQQLARWGRELDRRLADKKHLTKTKEQPMALEDYEPVAVRLDRWLKEHPNTQVLTELLTEPGAAVAVFKATLVVDGVIVSTGHAEEVRDDSGKRSVNATSHLENCETSAIGRALANAGAAGSSFEKRPSREEMAKVQRVTQQGETTISQPANAPSEKQVWLLKKLLKDQGKLPPANLASLDKFEVSRMIEALKNGEQPADDLPPEEPF